MRILVDIDDTIENLLEAWIKYLNNKYQQNVKIEDCHAWEMTKLFPNLSYNQIHEVLKDKSLWEIVTPKEDAIEYLQLLQKDNHEIILVTASSSFNIEYKYECILKKYFPFIPKENIILANKKQLINGDILIDDNINNLIGGAYRKILFTAQHNKQITVEGTDIIRVSDWKDCYNFIQMMGVD